MKTIIIVGILLVNLALILYSIAIIPVIIKKTLLKFTFPAFFLGIVCDLSATICMVIGSTHTALSRHGLIGYSALAFMILDVVLLFRFKAKNVEKTTLPPRMYDFTKMVYFWWLVAYASGAFIIMFR